MKCVFCNDIACTCNDMSCTKFMRRSRAGEKPGSNIAIPRLIGMLMNNKLVSLVRGVSITLGTVCNCGRDSAADTLSLILLFTMPLISIIFATAQPRFYDYEWLSEFIDLSDGAPTVIRYLLSRSILGSSSGLSGWPKKNFLSNPIGVTYVSEPQLQRRKLETRRSPSG